MAQNRNYLFILLIVFASCIIGLRPAIAADQPVSVQAQVDRDEVTVGESFLFQLKIDGDDSPAEPDLSGLQDFVVTPKGGGRNNREAVTIINGRINRTSEHGYIFRYELTPKHEGILTIPAIEIGAAGKTLLTQPVTVKVAKPMVSDEFKLRITFSAAESYIGQPQVLTMKWFVNSDIADFNFDLPFLDDQRFIFADHPEDSGYQGQDALAVNLRGKMVVARKGRDGQYVTVTLRKIIIPTEAGEFGLGRGKVFSKIITGYRQNKPGQSFNNLFGDIFGQRQAVYKQLITESADLHLTVLSLPAEGRPPEFTGLVGQYSIAAQADPTEVHVGDPITLNIMVTGGEYLDNVVMPSLNDQPEFSDNFKVPEEMAPGEIDGRVKVFTQTIRAKYPDVKEVPAISLNYFNPETGKYEFAATKGIPLQVNAVKIITARDAEGVAPGLAITGLTSADKGIAQNYIGDDILKTQTAGAISWFSSSTGLALILLPPGFYLLLLIPVYVRRKHVRDKETLQARKALPEFLRTLARRRKEINPNQPQQTVNGLVEAMRVYLGRRLLMPPGTLGYAEVAEVLDQRGVDAGLLADLKDILDWSEAYQYGAGGMNSDSMEDIREKLAAAQELFQKIEQCLKK